MNIPWMIMEWIWFSAGLLCVLTSIRQFSLENTSDGFMFIGLAILSFVMYYLRRIRRLSQKEKE